MITNDRMLDKYKMPTNEEINKHIGDKSVYLLNELNKYLRDVYYLEKQLKFPFGNNYGWGFKYFKKAKHIC